MRVPWSKTSCALQYLDEVILRVLWYHNVLNPISGGQVGICQFVMPMSWARFSCHPISNCEPPRHHWSAWIALRLEPSSQPELNIYCLPIDSVHWLTHVAVGRIHCGRRWHLKKKIKNIISLLTFLNHGKFSPFIFVVINLVLFVVNLTSTINLLIENDYMVNGVHCWHLLNLVTTKIITLHAK